MPTAHIFSLPTFLLTPNRVFKLYLPPTPCKNDHVRSSCSPLGKPPSHIHFFGFFSFTFAHTLRVSPPSSPPFTSLVNFCSAWIGNLPTGTTAEQVSQFASGSGKIAKVDVGPRGRCVTLESRLMGRVCVCVCLRVCFFFSIRQPSPACLLVFAPPPDRAACV